MSYKNFHQDNAPAHTIQNSMQPVCTVFDECITTMIVISTRVWLPHSLDLNMCNFYL